MTNIIIKERAVSYGFEVGWAALAGFVVIAVIGLVIYFVFGKRDSN